MGELADWMATDHLDNHMLRERELQIKYDLTVYVSEIAAARELGMSNAQVARRAGISPQAASNALAKARAKGVCLWEW